MKRYRPGDDVGALQDWPFESAASDYDILRGAPRASGRLDAGGPGHVTRSGIWRCTPGAFACTEQGDEMMVILAGRCRITDQASGEVLELGPGDIAYTQDGQRVIWDIFETVTKAFFAHKPDGY